MYFFQNQNKQRINKWERIVRNSMNEKTDTEFTGKG